MSIRLNPQPGLTAALIDGKLDISFTEEINPDNNSGGFQYVNRYYEINPLQNSPNETWNLQQYQVDLDPDLTGFTIGTAGNAINLINIGFNHDGTSDVGSLTYVNSYYDLGNGTDAIDVNGTSIFFGFGNINANVTMVGPIQGYGFQYSVNAAATIDSYISAFYDSCNIATAVESYVSYSASPTIADVKNNNNVTGINLNANISQFTGNAGYNGLAIAGTLSNFDTGTYNGILINSTVTGADFGYGLFVEMGNVTATNTYAAVFNGDVQINGDLSFSGALSIGKLTAYASQAVVDGGFNPTSIHQMVSAPTVAANATINNADTIGMNTAMLLTVGANATVTTNLLGLSALALPAVVSMAAGSTVDVVAGATFAVNLDAGAGGGTITELPLCQSLGIPNGITTVTDCYGYYMDMPFGLIGTNNYGIYVNADINNYFKGNLVIGSTDLPTNSSVGLELVSTTKAFLNARMTTTQRDALTAVNGMMIYNTSTDKLQVRAAGSWVDLH